MLLLPRVYSPAQYSQVLWQYSLSIVIILTSIVIILTSIEPILENVITCKCNNREYCHNTFMSFKKCQNWFKTYKYCYNTCKYFSSIESILKSTYEYCHNTCKYWAGEYTPTPIKNLSFYDHSRHPYNVNWCLDRVDLLHNFFARGLEKGAYSLNNSNDNQVTSQCNGHSNIFLLRRYLKYWWVVRKIYVNWAWTSFNVSPFAWNIKSVNDNFPLFLVILSENNINFSIISCEINDIKWIRRDRDFTT